MIKREIKETITEYDNSSKVVKTTVTETSETDDNTYSPYITTTPYMFGSTTGTITCSNESTGCAQGE